MVALGRCPRTQFQPHDSLQRLLQAEQQRSESQRQPGHAGVTSPHTLDRQAAEGDQQGGSGEAVPGGKHKGHSRPVADGDSLTAGAAHPGGVDAGDGVGGLKPLNLRCP